MSAIATAQIERDNAAAAEQRELFEQLTQDALHAWQDYLAAKKRYDEACARLAPYRQQLQAGAA
jgi:hypothetical protein